MGLPISVKGFCFFCSSSLAVLTALYSFRSSIFSSILVGGLRSMMNSLNTQYFSFSKRFDLLISSLINVCCPFKVSVSTLHSKQMEILLVSYKETDCRYIKIYGVMLLFLLKNLLSGGIQLHNYASSLCMVIKSLLSCQCFTSDLMTLFYNVAKRNDRKQRCPAQYLKTKFPPAVSNTKRNSFSLDFKYTENFTHLMLNVNKLYKII